MKYIRNSHEKLKCDFTCNSLEICMNFARSSCEVHPNFVCSSYEVSVKLWLWHFTWNSYEMSLQVHRTCWPFGRRLLSLADAYFNGTDKKACASAIALVYLLRIFLYSKTPLNSGRVTVNNHMTTGTRATHIRLLKTIVFTVIRIVLINLVKPCWQINNKHYGFVFLIQ